MRKKFGKLTAGLAFTLLMSAGACVPSVDAQPDEGEVSPQTQELRRRWRRIRDAAAQETTLPSKPDASVPDTQPAPAPVHEPAPAPAPAPEPAPAPAPAPAPPVPAPTPAPAPAPAPGGRGMFQAKAPWYQEVSAASLDPESATVMAGLQARGGWGGGSLRMDFSIEVLRADASTPMRTFTPNDEFYDPDCDNVPVPVPANGRLEGESGYTCASDGDCHLIVVQGDKLYEMWRANISGGTFSGGCMAVWDLKRDYWSSSSPASYGRGMQCTSADAAGYPITDLLFTADEVRAGEINHAIRFILPNDRIRKGELVLPATHSGVGKGTPTADTVPYGARLRLKASVDISALKPGAQVVARALKKYGMFLADGGNIALTGRADTDTAAKWDGLLNPGDLAGLKVSDFEMVDGGARVPVTNDCVRTR